MTADRFAPIPCPLPEVRKSQRHVPMTVLEPVEAARAQPCYAGMDDTADYAQTLPCGREALEGGLWLPLETRDERSALERRQDEIDEDRATEAAEWEARDRFIEGYDA